MRIARKFGTICYRSREEFDRRFAWHPELPGRPLDHSQCGGSGEHESDEAAATAAATSGENRDGDDDDDDDDVVVCDEPGHWEYDDEQGHRFEIEKYLDHAANKFVGATGAAQPYDPNCYLRLSQVRACMCVCVRARVVVVSLLPERRVRRAHRKMVDPQLQ